MGTFFKLPGGVFFHVGEPFTLSVKRGGANVEGRGHPLVVGVWMSGNANLE